GDTLHDMITSVGEYQSRSGGELTAGCADQHFAGSGPFCNPSRDMDCDSGWTRFRLGLLHLAGVDTCSDRKAELGKPSSDRQCAEDRSRGCAEEGKRTITRGIDDVTTHGLDLLADDVVVRGEELGPFTIADPFRDARRTDDIRDENRPDPAASRLAVDSSQHPHRPALCVAQLEHVRQV